MNLPSNERREALRRYLLMVLSSDAMSSARTKAEVVERFGAALLEDATDVVGDMAASLAEGVTRKAAEHAAYAGRRVGEFALRKVGEWLEGAKDKGFKNAWGDLQRAYWRGVDANARR